MATRAQQAFIDHVQRNLNHELADTSKRAARDLDRRSTPRPRFRSWEDQMADESGVATRGEI